MEVRGHRIASGVKIGMIMFAKGHNSAPLFLGN